MRDIEWMPRAERDLDRIHARISRDNPEAALRWVALLVARAEEAANMPGTGRRIPEDAQERSTLREVMLEGYRIMYRIRASGIEVFAVRHGRQHTDGDFLRDRTGDDE